MKVKKDYTKNAKDIDIISDYAGKDVDEFLVQLACLFFPFINGFGRIIWGFLVDIFSYKTLLQYIILFQIVSIIFLLIFSVFSSFVTKNILSLQQNKWLEQLHDKDDMENDNAPEHSQQVFGCVGVDILFIPYYRILV